MKRHTAGSASAKTLSRDGFTLIELLVVIAVIGLLASIILASLNNAREKGREAVIISEMNQLQTLAEEYNSDNGSYSGLQPGVWLPAQVPCTSLSAGTYTAQFVSICNAIIANETGTPALGAGFYFSAANQISSITKYSFTAWMQGTGRYYCAGSDGTSYTDTSQSGIGCYYNP